MRKPDINEEFPEFRERVRGSFYVRAWWKGRKSMRLFWGGDAIQYRLFPAALNSAGMDAELVAAWERGKPLCDRRGEFGHGSVYGHMNFVPIAWKLSRSCGVISPPRSRTSQAAECINAEST